MRSINREILRIVTLHRKKRKSQTRGFKKERGQGRKKRRVGGVDGGKEKAKARARVTENRTKCGRESASKTLRARLYPREKFLKRNYVPIEMSVSWK